MTIAMSFFEPIQLSAHQPHDVIDIVKLSPNFLSDQIVITATGALTLSINTFIILRSTDGGASWKPSGGLPNYAVNDIEFSPAFSTDKTVLVGEPTGLFKSTDGGVTFVAQSVTGGAVVQGIAFSPNYAKDGTVFLLTPTGVYMSANFTKSFAPVAAPGPLSGPLTYIAISPNYTADKTLLVGGTLDGLFKSANSGNSWISACSGATLPSVSAVAFSPGYKSDRTIFATSLTAGFFVSTNAGSVWTASNNGATDLTMTSLALYPGWAQHSSLMVSTQVGNVYVSGNRGQSWTKTAALVRKLSPPSQTTDHFRYVTTGVLSQTASVAFMATYEGLWKTTNKGALWTYVNTLPTWLVRQLQISNNFAGDKTLFVSSYGGGSLLSGDMGRSWAFLNTGLGNSYPDPAGISPNFDTDQTLFLGISSGLERSKNAGASWALMPAVGATCYARALGLSPNFASDLTVLIGVATGESSNPPTVTYQGNVYPNSGVFLSLDGGVDWMPTSLGGVSITNMAVSPNFGVDRTAFATSYTNGLYQTLDGGMTWNLAFNLTTDPGVETAAISPAFAVDHTVFTNTANSGLYKSVDAGLTWNQLTSAGTLTGLAFALSPNYLNDQTLFVSTLQSGLLKSQDGGNSFSPAGLDQGFVTSVVLSPNFTVDGTLFASGYDGIFESTNGGDQWTFIQAPNRVEDSRNFDMIFSKEWTQINDPSASDATYTSIMQGGGTMTLNFIGSGVRVVSQTGPQWGNATVTLDGNAAGTAKMFSLQTLYEQTVFVSTKLTCAPHTLVVTATSSGANIDAIDVVRDGCSY